MRFYIHLLFLVVIMLCGCKPQSQVPQIPQIPQANIAHQPMLSEISRESGMAIPAIHKDTVVCKYKYKNTIHGYRVRGEVMKIDSHYSNTIVFTDVATKKSFSITNSMLYYTKCDAGLDYQPHHSDKKGVVTAPLAKLIEDGEQYDEVIAIGPLIMMKFVVATTKPHNIKTMVSMNPIMIDGTGMCGGCRLTVGGKTKFACVDGPDFDGFEVDFDEAISRSRSYPEFEARAREKACKLFKKEEN